MVRDSLLVGGLLLAAGVYADCAGGKYASAATELLGGDYSASVVSYCSSKYPASPITGTITASITTATTLTITATEDSTTTITVEPTVTSTPTDPEVETPINKRADSTLAGWEGVDPAEETEYVTITNTKTYCPSCYAGTASPAYTWSSWESSGLDEATTTTPPHYTNTSTTTTATPTHTGLFDYFISRDDDFVSTVCGCIVTPVHANATVTATITTTETTTTTTTAITTATCSADLFNDKNNCGTCDNVCDSGHGCVAGVCTRLNPCDFSGEIEYCYDDGQCVCYETIEGEGFCADGDGACGALCDTSADCPGNNVCLTAATIGCGDANTCSTDSDLTDCANAGLPSRIFARDPEGSYNRKTPQNARKF